MTEDPDSSGITIDLVVQTPGWGGDQGALAKAARRAALAAVAAAPEAAALPRPLEISLVLADDAVVRALNRDYRDQDEATNVLSFAQLEDDHAVAVRAPDAPLLLGDVVLAKETLAREAAAAGKSLSDHLSHLVVHGVLHLFGYRHEEDDDARRMEALEAAVLATLRIADPYAGEDDRRASGAGGVLGAAR